MPAWVKLIPKEVWITLGGLALVAAILWMTYQRGRSDERGEWQQKLAAAELGETRHIEQPQMTGEVEVKPKGDRTPIKSPERIIAKETSDQAIIDSLQRIVYTQAERIAELEQPRDLVIENPVIGFLHVEYDPTGRTPARYVHNPPPKQVEIRYIERERDWWEIPLTIAATAAVTYAGTQLLAR